MKASGYLTKKADMDDMDARDGNNLCSGLKLTKRPLGRILVDGRFITEQDLERAVEEQRSTGEPLGDVLVRMGALDPADLKAALYAQRRLATMRDAARTAAGPRRMLGELLLQAEHITEEQFDLALEEHNRTGEKLGEVLVRQGAITDKELNAVLIFQSHLGDEETDSTGFRLGEILVTTNRITYEQLKNALARQQITRKKLGDVIVEAGYTEEHHIDYALKIQHKLVTAAIVAVLSLAHVPEIDAGLEVARAVPESTHISVSAAVRPHAWLKVMRQTPEIVVTNADISRGYVEVYAASLFQIKNNSPAGYLLVFESAGAGFKEVHVTGLGHSVVLTNGSNWVAQPYTGKAPVTVELSYRFIIHRDLSPGTYAWPLKASVTPL